MGDNGKRLLVAAIALVIGLVIGGYGPRSELRGLQAQVTQLENKRCDRDVGKKIFGEVFRPRAPAPAPAPAPVEQAPPPDPDAPQVDAPAPEPTPAQRDRRGQPSSEQVQSMKDALDLRRAQAEAALREQAGATDEQMEDVDRIVADMNTDLEALANEFVAAVGVGEQPSRHDMMSFAADTLDVLMGTEEALGGVLDQEQLQGLTADALDPTAYVDGTVVDVLAQLDRP